MHPKFYLVLQVLIICGFATLSICLLLCLLLLSCKGTSGPVQHNVKVDLQFIHASAPYGAKNVNVIITERSQLTDSVGKVTFWLVPGTYTMKTIWVRVPWSDVRYQNFTLVVGTKAMSKIFVLGDTR